MKLTEVPYEQTKSFTKSILRHTLIKNCRNKTISKYGGIKTYFKMLFLLCITVTFNFIIPKPILISSTIVMLVALFLAVLFGVMAIWTIKHNNYLIYFLLENTFGSFIMIILSIEIINCYFMLFRRGFFSNGILFTIIFYILLALLIIYIIWRCWNSVKKDLSIQGSNKFSILKNADVLAKKLYAYGLPVLAVFYILRDVLAFISGKLNIDHELKGICLIWIALPICILIIFLLEVVYFPMYVLLPAYYLWKYRAEYERDNHFSYEGKKAEVK